MGTNETVALAWKRVEATGLERFELEGDATTWTLRGTILLLHQGAPFEARYELTCDPAWRTRAVTVDVRGPLGGRSLRLTAEDGRWRDEKGTEIEAFRGCVDVDLSWSPSTNTLPIRRLGLAVMRGLLLDLVATDDHAATTAALERFASLVSAGDISPSPSGRRRRASR